MGKIKKIPFIKEFALYVFKAIIFFIIMKLLLEPLGLYHPGLTMIAVVFLAFTFRIGYFGLFLGSFFIFYYLASLTQIEFIELFIYLANILINMFITLIFIKKTYHYDKDK